MILSITDERKSSNFSHYIKMCKNSKYWKVSATGKERHSFLGDSHTMTNFLAKYEELQGILGMDVDAKQRVNEIRRTRHTHYCRIVWSSEGTSGSLEWSQQQASVAIHGSASRSVCLFCAEVLCAACPC